MQPRELGGSPVRDRSRQEPTIFSMTSLRLLPSTQFIDTFRAVSVYGESLAHYGVWIAALVLWAVAGTAISARTFRWV